MTLTDTRRSLLVLTSIMLFQILRPSRAFSTRQQGSWIQNGRRKFHPTKCSLKAATTSTDNEYLLQAVQHATLGKGHTFPNPAVGCVLVRQDTGEVVGKGFHPRAGYPHAEVFALLEAAGHIPDGVAAAKAVVDQSSSQSDMLETVQKLLETYSTEDGPEELFANALAENPVTAYVTLEPCCHFGKTPPCAVSLAMSRVKRVVVGVRDPNPRVDGGGVQLLESVGVDVDLAEDTTKAACETLVTNFFNRITPNDLRDDFSYINGAKRSALRSQCNTMKREKRMAEVSWGGGSVPVNDEMEQAINELELSPEWMEHLDDLLWREEMVVLRLTNAIKKKKGINMLGNRIAGILKAHVAQTKGHTVLLYRPADPPIIDLDDLVRQSKKTSESDEKVER